MTTENDCLSDAKLQLEREHEFFKNQFTSLRKEIEDAKTRVFQAMGVGLIVVPGSQMVPHIKSVPLITGFLPLLVIVSALVYLSESSAIIRCGTYIRHHIEPRFKPAVGWEDWLERDEDNREIDRLLAWAFQCLFVVYYVISSWLGWQAARTVNELWGLLVGICYAVLGIALVFFLFYNARVNTKVQAND